MNISKKLTSALLVGFVFSVSQHLQAQTTVEKGKTISIEIEIPFESKAIPSSSGFSNTNKSSPMDCNIEVTHGSEKTNVRVDAKTHKGIYPFEGRRLGEETINWEGKTKFRGLKTLGGCSGEGQLTVVTIESAEEIKATAQVQKADEEAKQVQATIDAQAARLAELEMKLKAAEEQAAKTPEQKAEEVRITAEAKAVAEAKVAAEMKAEAEKKAPEKAKAAGKWQKIVGSDCYKFHERGKLPIIKCDGDGDAEGGFDPNNSVEKAKAVEISKAQESLGNKDCVEGDCLNGQGTKNLKKGRYVGQFKDGKKHGQGTYTRFDNTYKYVGQYKNDKRHGQGTWTNSDFKYVGQLKDHKMHGQGTATFNNGDKYVGEFKDNKYYGQGTFTYNNGNKYVGQFKDSKRDGQGTLTYNNGDKYVGEWKDGKEHGNGSVFSSSGKKMYEGRWKDGGSTGNWLIDPTQANKKAKVQITEVKKTTKYFFNIDEGMSAKYQMTLDELEGWCFASTFLNTSNNGTPATKTLQRALKVYQPLIKKIVPLREVCIAETGATTQGELNTCLRRKLQGTPNLNIVIAAVNVVMKTGDMINRGEFDKRDLGLDAMICAHIGPDGFY